MKTEFALDEITTAIHESVVLLGSEPEQKHCKVTRGTMPDKFPRKSDWSCML